MSVNSSSSCNSSFPPPPLISYNMYYLLGSCFSSTVGGFTITTFAVANVLLLLPPCILVLHLGRQRRQQMSSDATASSSELFTYHIVVMQLMSIFGSTMSCCGVHADLPELVITGIYFFFFTLNGEMFLHVLICVERYLAVVHPITYRGLRKSNGIRIRKVSIGCAWLMSFTGTCVVYITDSTLVAIIALFISGFALNVIAFCSLYVLCILIRPGPAERVGGRQRVDQSKLRAFNTIVSILGVLLLRFGGNILTFGLYTSQKLGEAEKCGLWFYVIWFSIPISLVSPLLFLHRAGKLPCCQKNTEGSD